MGDGNIERNQKANLDYWGPNREHMMVYARELVHATVGGRSDLMGHIAKTGYARVQSVALRIIVEREQEIKKFKPEEYWSLHAKLSSQRSSEQ